MPEVWSEPFTSSFANMVLGTAAMEHLGPMMVGAAVKGKNLSERALYVIVQLLESQGDEAFFASVDLGDGSSRPLLTLCLQLTEQSYELSCSKFDEPQLSIFSITMLCMVSLRFHVGIDWLVRMSQKDRLACARVAVCCIANQVPCQIKIYDNFASCVLEDLRGLIKRRHNDTASILVRALPTLAPLFGTEGASVTESLELMYLFAEYLAGKGDYWKVIDIPNIFPQLWQRLSTDKALKKDAHPIHLCMARAYEATGSLSKAREIYSSCGVPDLSDLDSCLSGTKMYASIKALLPLRNVESLKARLIGNGKIALFFLQKEGKRNTMRMNFLDPESGDLTDIQLPNQSQRPWRAVTVIPDQPSCVLRVLVASVSGDTAQDDKEDMISRMMSALGPLSMTGEQREPIEKVELWEWRDNNTTWRQITTRGCIPDQLVVTRIGNGCVPLGPYLIVFGGCEVAGTLGRSSTSNESSGGAFILDTHSREWFRVPHPYRKNLFVGPCPPKQLSVALPSFSSVWKVDLGGQPMIAMLRNGSDEVNQSRNNEKVPKYALDFFGIVDGAGRPEAFWALDVATKDRCGYLASLRGCCVQIGQSCLVLGSDSTSIIQRLQEDGTSLIEPRATEEGLLFFNALDMNGLEWRGLLIHNVQNLQGDDRQTQYNLIPSLDPNMCFMLNSSLKALQGSAAYQISNQLRNVSQSNSARRSDSPKRIPLATSYPKLERTVFVRCVNAPVVAALRRRLTLSSAVVNVALSFIALSVVSVVIGRWNIKPCVLQSRKIKSLPGILVAHSRSKQPNSF